MHAIESNRIQQRKTIYFLYYTSETLFVNAVCNQLSLSLVESASAYFLQEKVSELCLHYFECDVRIFINNVTAMR